MSPVIYLNVFLIIFFSFLRTAGTNRRSSSNISSQGTIINFSLWQICDYLGTMPRPWVASLQPLGDGFGPSPTQRHPLLAQLDPPCPTLITDLHSESSLLFLLRAGQKEGETDNWMGLVWTTGVGFREERGHHVSVWDVRTSKGKCWETE